MGDHAAKAKSDGHPVQALVGSPAVEQVAQAGIDEADAERPEAHLGLFDPAVAACKEDDNSVGEDAGEVAKYAADECRQKH